MSRPTRSFGLLEGILAAKRAAVADSLIPGHLRDGALLDLGCGVTPRFLLKTRFARKVGIDPYVEPRPEWLGLELLRRDITDMPWPFAPEHFSAITMLAVLEHLPPESVVPGLSECYRVLAPGGALVITHPARWTGALLRTMASLRLVSRAEIEDHRGSYGHMDVVAWLAATGFEPAAIQFGSFELGANRWVRASRRESGVPQAGAALRPPPVGLSILTAAQGRR